MPDPIKDILRFVIILKWGQALSLFIDRFGKDIAIRPAEQDKSMIAVDVAISSQFFGWIFGLGSDVIITGPDAVVEEYKTELEKCLEAFTE